MNILSQSPGSEIWLTHQQNFVIPDKKVKRKPGPVDFSVFSEEQMAAATELMEFVDTTTRDVLYKILKGYAGTGKTFLMSRLIEWLVYSKKMRVAVTAPTNKAVRVGKDMSEIEHKSINHLTIHKLLGLKQVYDVHGRLGFVPDPMKANSLDAYHVLIVDEVSMLDNKLFSYIHEYASREDSTIKVIFVGDPAQIPPVNHNECIPFMPNKQRLYRMQECELTQIRRQALDNPILHLATHIRENRHLDADDYVYETSIHGENGLICIPKAEKDLIYHLCRDYFCNDKFRDYPDFMKVIAWENKVANAVNAKVRQFIFNREELPLVMVGEKLLVDAPIKHYMTESILYTNNTELEVLNTQLCETPVHLEIFGERITKNNIQYYNCTVAETDTDSPTKNEIRVIHENSALLYKSILQDLEIRILQAPYFERSKAWRTYYQFKETWAQVKYNYAITAHKSQGSTYENCMVLQWNMRNNPRYEERNRIRYVAMTRARSRLFVVN